jgi:hypothetical protein
MPLIAGGFAVAFVAGLGLAVLLRQEQRSGPKPVATAAAPAARPAQPTAVATPVLPAAPALPPPVVLATNEPPWAYVGTVETVDVPERPAVAPVVARQPLTVREGDRPAVAAVARTDDRMAPPRSMGEPYVHLASVAYSSVAGKRTASLTVNGTPFVLHEGQSADNVQVTLILPDRVYLRHAGQVFAVHQGR